LPRLTIRALNAALRYIVQRRLRMGLTVEAIRRAGTRLERWIAGGALAAPGVPVAAGGVACEWLGPPTTDNQRIVLYLHGGGFITHMPSAYRVFARRLGAALGATVLLPDYRLAPEHPFPSGADDCIGAYRWLLAQGFDAKRIVIGGDSAGGNLALVTAIRIRDEALPAPGCVFMLSPATDFSGASASIKYNRKRDPLLVPEVQALLLAAYAPTVDASHPWISPIFDNLNDLPPLLFQAGCTELIVDDSIRAADKARWAGVAVELEVWPDMPHVFQMINALPEAHAAIAEIGRFVRLHVPTPVPTIAERECPTVEATLFPPRLETRPDL
jgi:epsilon-lactone hydrolase